jgi:O-antigen ligase
MAAPAKRAIKPARPASAGRSAAIVLAIILAMATLLLAQSPFDGPIRAESRPPLSYLSRAITIPLAMNAGSDLRCYAPVLGIAAALLLVAIRPPATAARGGPWFEVLCAATAAVAVVSALANGTWELSRGWILWMACGAGWAVAVSRLIATDRAFQLALAGAAVVAILAAAATLWHRHILGIRYLLWPIGPITISAALGAVWAAGGLGQVFAAPGIGRRSVVPIACSVAVAALGLSLVIISGRVAAWAGLVAAVVWLGGLVILRRSRAGRWRRAGVAAAAIVLIAAGACLIRREIAARQDVAGSFAVRTIYWRAIASALPAHWLLGVGPDQFVVRATSDLARQRAEMPRVLHGTLDRAAHSEWLQTTYELGVPGGLLYLAIPVATLAAAARAYRRLPDGPRRAALAAASAGLVAIVVCEAGSVNLRYGTLPAWYWTLIGLTRAASRDPEQVPISPPPWAPRPMILRLAAGGAALALLLIVANDVLAGHAHARARAAMARGQPEAARDLLRLAAVRLGAEQWLRTRSELGEAVSALDPAVAVDTWQELVDRCPAYPGAGGRLAEALLRAGEPAEARDVLARHFDAVDPYDAFANMLQADAFETAWPGRIECVRRAARSKAIDGPMQRDIANWLSDPATLAEWHEQVRRAEADAALRPEPDWNDPLAPETLRVEAARLAAIGDVTGAARLAALAADACRELADTGNPRRRPAEAEADAWRCAAEYLFQSDPGAYAEALRMAREAERLAVLGISHERLRSPAGGDFVGDVVIPTELPPHMRPVWRLSAKLGMAAGSERNLDLRIWSSLPEDRWTAEAAAAERAQLARELVSAFERVPPERRPPAYQRLFEMARGTAGG